MCKCGHRNKRSKGAGGCVGPACGGGSHLYEVKVEHTADDHQVVVSPSENIGVSGGDSDPVELRSGSQHVMWRSEADDLIAQGAPLRIL